MNMLFESFEDLKISCLKSTHPKEKLKDLVTPQDITVTLLWPFRTKKFRKKSSNCHVSLGIGSSSPSLVPPNVEASVRKTKKRPIARREAIQFTTKLHHHMTKGFTIHLANFYAVWLRWSSANLFSSIRNPEKKKRSAPWCSNTCLVQLRVVLLSFVWFQAVRMGVGSRGHRVCWSLTHKTRGSETHTGFKGFWV